MLLETVWSALPENQWGSIQALGDALDLDEETLGRILNFLIRWDFAEVKGFPCCSVRRKAGKIPPYEAIELLRSLSGTESYRKASLAERVACRNCAGRNFRFVGENLVECTRCNEKQWFTIEIVDKNRV